MVTIESGSFSDNFLKFAKETGIQNMTNTQHKFAEWLMHPDNVGVLLQIGSLEDMFISVRKFVKNNQELF